VCEEHGLYFEDEYIKNVAFSENIKDLCPQFKNKADFVEVKHGRWKSEMRERCDWRGKKQNYYQPNSCSVCHEAVVERTPYCPYCGAKMDGERRNT
jgi:hypothetical protein